jgi:hypothetical protein
MKKIILLSLMILTTVLMNQEAYACSSCGCTVCQLGKYNAMTIDYDKKWLIRFVYDQIAWRHRSAESANNLATSDHDVHDRTKDTAYRYEIGRRLTEDFSLLIDVPYVTKDTIEFMDIDHLGEKQTSKGLGDVQLLGDYRIWHNKHNAISLAGGIKFPSGDTHRKDHQGNRFETDMQPGSGAYNYIAGGVYKFQSGRFSLTSNISRIFTLKGAQGFEYGDLLTASLYGDYLINPQARSFQTRLGIDTVFQDEWKEKTNGVKNPDSGGQTTLMGPGFRMDATQNLSLTGTFLYPVSQQLNGFTQRQGFEWTLATEVRF